MVDHMGVLNIERDRTLNLDHHESGFRRIAPRLITHIVLATIVSTIVGFVLLGFLHLRPVAPHFFLITLLADAPYSPAFWGSALSLGFLVNKRMADRCALWVGPIAALMFALLIGLSLPGFQGSGYELKQSNNSFARYVYFELFSLDSKFSSDGGLGKFLFTMPALSCIAYSLGAWVALRHKHRISGSGSLETIL